MTVSTTANAITYLGNGATTTFSFSFPVIAAADINVIFTDANGVMTTLAPTAYSVVLNAAVAPNVTGAGGTVTYNPVGGPIASGTKLTIQRNVPLTQPTSFANQSTLYQTAIEQALDYVTVLIQQVNALFSNAVAGPVSDPAGLTYTLPSVAKRANQTLGFDSSGNVTTLAGPAAGTISAAMQPVVNAATLALGRTNLGLGNVAVETIGTSLADDGAGNLRVLFAPVVDAADQAVTASFHMSQRFMTGSHTYTLPRANTLFSGFGFTVTALTAAVTFAINVNDSFVGGSAGASLVIPAGTSVYLTTDAAASGTWFIQAFGSVDNLGFNAPLNLQLNASVASHALTIAIKDRNGNDPSTGSPVILTFRDPTVTNGDPVTRTVTAANSITVPQTATLGTTSGNAARIWVVAFDNAGTISLGVIVCTTATQQFTLDETSTQSPTQVAGGSNSAGTFYSAAGGIAGKSFRILGFVEATEAVAGTWDTAPSKIQLFGPGVKKPGDTVQTIRTATGAFTTGTTTVSAWATDNVPTNAMGDHYSGLDTTITPSFAGNLLDIEVQAFFASNTPGPFGMMLLQDATVNCLTAAQSQIATANISYELRIQYEMLAGTTSATTFKINAGNGNANITTFNGISGARNLGGKMNSYTSVREIMA